MTTKKRRWVTEYTEHVPGIQSTVTQPEDPAYHHLLMNPNVPTTPQQVYVETCYICVDPEFARMGLPLCKPCPECKRTSDGNELGHVPADDIVCSVCGFDLEEAWNNGNA